MDIEEGAQELNVKCIKPKSQLIEFTFQINPLHFYNVAGLFLHAFCIFYKQIFIFDFIILT
jgi:hypothetical protein